MPELTGRELDAAVARAIGAEVARIATDWKPVFYVRNGSDLVSMPRYSTDANAMIEALEVMQLRGWIFSVFRDSMGIGPFRFNLCRNDQLAKGDSPIFTEAGSRAIVAAAELEVAGAE